MVDAALTASKPFWQSKTIIAGGLGVILALYLFIQQNFAPGLPVPPTGIIDTIVGVLSAIGIFGRATATQTIS